MSFSYHTVDVHAGLQEGLDGAVVAVPCSQVKRRVPATVAGHEVGVGVDQHAHHLHTNRGPMLHLLGFRTCQSSVSRRGAAERPDRTHRSSTGVPPFLRILPCVQLLNFCPVSVTSVCSGSFHRRDFPSL